MNQFEELCSLASRENWCWKLFCTTCGGMHFRYAFSELALGKSPNDPDWIIHSNETRYTDLIGFPPIEFSAEQKQIIITICNNAILSKIAETSKFPDWLGYLGLVLENMYSSTNDYRNLSMNWSSQLLALLPENSSAANKLSAVSQGDCLLSISDLELCEEGLSYY